ncbi:hypothetical protein [Actinomycetospora chibensis]|uniref:Uncharacterized protein n=1 Tax=Actinomycetospora chibensis TaxID=663606 RepID=A0ABV9RKH6_9PSEU|nr:hypothetical protein [Actinomycetospora chibensis]MDD7926546.1 hypothetical protein [Actinomycetospora chibensis]
MSIDHDVRFGLGAGLDALAPGAELAAALDRVSAAALTGEDLAAYVRGRWRLLNRASAELLEGLHHLGRAQAGRTERLASCDGFSGDEVSAQLGWSRTMSSPKLDLPDDGWDDHRTDTHDDIDPDWFQKLTQKTRPTATIPTRGSYDDEPPF